MGIIDNIKNTIKYNSNDHLWLQTSDESANYSNIEDNEITLELFYFVGTGDNFERDDDRKNLEESTSQSRPLNFGDGYDFDGWATRDSMTKDDVEWIMENHETFFHGMPLYASDYNDNPLQVVAVDYFWGDNDIPGSSGVGLKGFFDSYNWAKGNVEGGIANSTDREIALNYVKLRSRLPGWSDIENNKDGFRSWVDINYNITRNLLKAEKDIGVIVEELATAHNYNDFVRDASTIMALTLDFGDSVYEDLLTGGFMITDDDVISTIDETSLSLASEPIILSETGIAAQEIFNNSSAKEINKLVIEYDTIISDDKFMITRNHWLDETYGGSAFPQDKFDRNTWSNNHKDAEDHIDLGPQNGEKHNAIKAMPEYKFMLWSSDDNQNSNTDLSYTLENDSTININQANFPSSVLSSRDANDAPKNYLSFQDEIYDDKKAPINLEEFVLNIYVNVAIQLIATYEEDRQIGDGSNAANRLEDKWQDFCKTAGYYFACQYIASFINNVKGELFDVLYDFAANWSKGDDAEDLKELRDQALSKLIQKYGEQGDSAYEEEEEETTAETLEEREKSVAQCALLVNLEKCAKKFDDINKIMIPEQNPNEVKDKIPPQHQNSIVIDGMTTREYYNGRLIRINGTEHHSTKTKLLSSKGDNLQAFLQMTPDVQACLVPKIEIYKVYTNEKRQKVTALVPFHKISRDENGNVYTANKINTLIQTSDKFFRGGAVGLKDVSFVFDGETPATAEKFIQAEMTIIAQDFRDMVINRKTKAKVDDVTEDVEFRYLDLIVNSGENIDNDEHKPSNYVLRIDVGWNIGDLGSLKAIINNSYGKGSYSDSYYDSLVQSIRNQNRSFTICMIDHDINITENGKIEIKINYRGYAESFLASKEANALVTHEEKQVLNDSINTIKRKINTGSCSTRVQKAGEKQIQLKIAEQREKFYQSIAKRLMSHGMIRTVTIDDPSAVEKFKKVGSFDEKPEITIYGSPPTQFPEGAKNFFYLSDLLYLLLDSIHDKSGSLIEQCENFSFILSDFSYPDQFVDTSGAAKTIIVNIGSIPITMEFFKEFITEKVIDKERNVYPLFDMMNDILNELMTDFLSESCFANKLDKSIQFKISNFNIMKEDIENLNNYSYTKLTNNNSGILSVNQLNDFLPLMNPAQNAGMVSDKDVKNTSLIYCDISETHHKGKGSIAEDLEVGIPHLYFGAKAGLVKNISFSKTNIQYLRESRMERNKGMGDIVQLANVYNASIKMFGNFLFLPGMQIFINPKSLGGSEFGDPIKSMKLPNGKINFSRLMGIGGYYLITKVSTTLGVSGFNTDVEALFVFSGDENGNSNGIDRKESTTDAEPISVSSPDSSESDQNAAVCREIIVSSVSQ